MMTNRNSSSDRKPEEILQRLRDTAAQEGAGLLSQILKTSINGLNAQQERLEDEGEAWKGNSRTHSDEERQQFAHIDQALISGFQITKQARELLSYGIDFPDNKDDFKLKNGQMLPLADEDRAALMETIQKEAMFLAETAEKGKPFDPLKDRNAYKDAFYVVQLMSDPKDRLDPAGAFIFMNYAQGERLKMQLLKMKPAEKALANKRETMEENAANRFVGEMKVNGFDLPDDTLKEASYQILTAYKELSTLRDEDMERDNRDTSNPQNPKQILAYAAMSASLNEEAAMEEQGTIDVPKKGLSAMGEKLYSNRFFEGLTNDYLSDLGNVDAQMEPEEDKLYQNKAKISRVLTDNAEKSAFMDTIRANDSMEIDRQKREEAANQKRLPPHKDGGR